MSHAQNYIRTALDGFRMDPPDSDFQRGYKAALETVLKEAFPRRDFTHLEVDVALCVWDELLMRRINTEDSDPYSDQDRPYAEMNAYWDDYGTPQMRQDAMDIGLWVESVWLAMTEAERDFLVFDWEFVPRLIDQLRWDETRHMYQRDGKFPTPSVESAIAHYRLAYGFRK